MLPQIFFTLQTVAVTFPCFFFIYQNLLRLCKQNSLYLTLLNILGGSSPLHDWLKLITCRDTVYWLRLKCTKRHIYVPWIKICSAFKSMPKRVLIGISSWLSSTKHSIKCRQFVRTNIEETHIFFQYLGWASSNRQFFYFLKFCAGDNSEMWFLTMDRFERSFLTMKNIWSLMHLSFCWKHIYNWFFIIQLWNYSF